MNEEVHVEESNTFVSKVSDLEQFLPNAHLLL